MYSSQLPAHTPVNMTQTSPPALPKRQTLQLSTGQCWSLTPPLSPLLQFQPRGHPQKVVTVILSEAGQTEKDKYYMIWLICSILQKTTSELTCEKQSYRCRTQAYGSQGVRQSGGIKWKIWIDTYIQPCTKQITNKDLLYSTRKVK